MMKRALPLLLSLAACTDDGGGGGGPTGDSHVETYEVAAFTPPTLDLLIVVEDTAAMAPHQTALAALPGQLEQVLATNYQSKGSYHIGVVTTDASAGGKLRTSSSLTGAYLFHEDVFTAPQKNYQGSLGSALGSLMPASAASSAANQPLETMKLALGNTLDNAGFLRSDAFLGVLTIAATDDASTGTAVQDYAAMLKAHKADPSRVFVSGIFDPASTRLASFHALFPNRNDVSSIDAADYSVALAGFTQLFKRTLGYACDKEPADLDPMTPGPQYDCSFVAITDAGEMLLPECKGDYSRPCWEIVIDTMICVDPAAKAHLSPRGFGDPFHPMVRGQCIVN